MAALPTTHLIPPSDATQPTAVLLQLGTFSPITNAHLRLLVCARDSIRNTHHVAGAYISPVCDQYEKPDMVSAKHRVQMARLAVSSLPWAVVDDWESLQHDAVPSFQVAQRVKDGTNWLADVVHVFFVCGQDMLVAMRNPNIWPAVNVSRLRRIVRFAVHARPDVEGGCEAWRGAVVLKGWVGDLSSTVVRQHVKDGRSIRFMTRDPVVDYIALHSLFL